MVEAFRNNFVAVIVFLMTVLLTDSIDFSLFLVKAVSSNVVAVCVVFIMSSIFYLIATIVMSHQKWVWLEQAYDDLKANYRGTLEDKDIEESFNYDQPIKTAEKQFNEIRCWMIGLWIAMIIVLVMFTGKLYLSANSTKEPKYIIGSSETEITEIPSSEVIGSVAFTK